MTTPEHLDALKQARQEWVDRERAKREAHNEKLTKLSNLDTAWDRLFRSVFASQIAP